MIYNVTYYRHDKKTTEIKSIVNVESMRAAVEIIVNDANKAGVKISKISCMVNNSHGIQRFCDVCLLNEAMYGFKKMLIHAKVASYNLLDYVFINIYINLVFVPSCTFFYILCF